MLKNSKNKFMTTEDSIRIMYKYVGQSPTTQWYHLFRDENVQNETTYKTTHILSKNIKKVKVTII